MGKKGKQTCRQIERGRRMNNLTSRQSDSETDAKRQGESGNRERQTDRKAIVITHRSIRRCRSVNRRMEVGRC